MRANHGQHMVDRGKASVGMGKRRALRETVHLSAFGSLQLVYSIKTVPYVPCKYLLCFFESSQSLQQITKITSHTIQVRIILQSSGISVHGSF